MNRHSWLVLPALLFGLNCDGPQESTGLRQKGPGGISSVIGDGAHNNSYKDFFFLPPMVRNPSQHPNYDAAKFNHTLQPSLTVEICELNLAVGALPTNETICVAGAPVKRFGPGTVKLTVTSGTALPVDGYYSVLWDTGQSNLDPAKSYRIRVLIHGSTVPLGVADVDPVSNMREMRNLATGDVIPLLDGRTLPIKFRVEKGALCEDAALCTSVTVTNDNPNGDSQIVQVAGEDGVPVAGVLLPDGWLPVGEGRPQSVVFTIRRVNTGVNNVAAGTQEFPCHGNLPLQQFDACFNYSTIPELDPIDPNYPAIQFAVPIIAAVCFVLHDTEDPREPWVQLWSSEPDQEGDQPIPLKSADASAILTNHDGEDCSTQDIIITDNNANALTRFASAGWQKLTRGFGRVFGVKTAYAVDIGIGGILDGISNIGPALTAEIRESSSTDPVTVGPGTPITTTVRVVGTKVHDGQPLGEVAPGGKTQGIPGLPVSFTLFSSSGAPVPFTAPGSPIQLTTLTDASGFATVPWTPPGDADTYTLKVRGQAKNGPKTYTATVTPAVIPAGWVGFGTPDIGENSRQVINPYTDAVTGVVFTAGSGGGFDGIVGISRNTTSGTSACVLPEDGDQKLGTAPVGSTSIGLSSFPITATFPTTMPAGTALKLTVQTGVPETGDNVVEVRFLNAAGAQVGIMTAGVSGVPDMRCPGAPGLARTWVTLTTITDAAFKSIVVTGPGNAVFLIDNLFFGPPGSFD